MRRRQSFGLKPFGAFRIGGAAKVVWLFAFALGALFGLRLDHGAHAAPFQLEAKPGLNWPEEAPADKAPADETGPDETGAGDPATNDTGFDDADPNAGGIEEVPLGQAGTSQGAPDELDDNPTLKPDVKQGGEGAASPQSTEENKQDRLGPRHDNSQAGDMPLLAPLDRSKLLDQLYDELASAKDLAEARPIMGAIDEMWKSSGSDTVDLLLTRVDSFTKDADLDLAMQVLDALEDLAPENAEVWHKRANVETLREDYTSALADLRRSLSLDPRNYSTMSDLGNVLEKVGAKKEALEAYSKALKANPFLDEARDAVKELTHEVEGQDI
jgi:tetratricopeptide (TPR) repeat protein